MMLLLLLFYIFYLFLFFIKATSHATKADKLTSIIYFFPFSVFSISNNNDAHSLLYRLDCIVSVSVSVLGIALYSQVLVSSSNFFLDMLQSQLLFFFFLIRETKIGYHTNMGNCIWFRVGIFRNGNRSNNNYLRH